MTRRYRNDVTEPPLVVVGWGPLRLPGERQRMRAAQDAARSVLAPATQRVEGDSQRVTQVAAEGDPQRAPQDGAEEAPQVATEVNPSSGSQRTLGVPPQHPARARVSVSRLAKQRMQNLSPASMGEVLAHIEGLAHWWVRDREMLLRTSQVTVGDANAWVSHVLTRHGELRLVFDEKVDDKHHLIFLALLTPYEGLKASAAPESLVDFDDLVRESFGTEQQLDRFLAQVPETPAPRETPST